MTLEAAFEKSIFLKIENIIMSLEPFPYRIDRIDHAQTNVNDFIDLKKHTPLANLGLGNSPLKTGLTLFK